MKSRNYRPSGAPPPEFLPKRQRRQKRSADYCVRHDRTPSRHVPMRDPAFKSAVKQQLAAMAERQAILADVAARLRGHVSASRQDLESLRESF